MHKYVNKSCEKIVKKVVKKSCEQAGAELGQSGLGFTSTNLHQIGEQETVKCPLTTCQQFTTPNSHNQSYFIHFKLIFCIPGFKGNFG